MKVKKLLKKLNDCSQIKIIQQYRDEENQIVDWKIFEGNVHDCNENLMDDKVEFIGATDIDELTIYIEFKPFR